MANSAKIKKFVKSKQVISALDSAKSLRLSRSLETGIPWTQQSFGCREPGDFIYIPSTFLNKSQNHHHDNQEMADHMFRQWTKFYHGLFDDNVLSSNVTSGSRQDSFCLGSTPLSIIHSRSVLFLFTINGFLLDLLNNYLETNFIKFDLM